MTTAPSPAFLAEFFPGPIATRRCRCRNHIGKRLGRRRLVPIITTSVYLSTNSVGWALVYPIGLPLIMFMIAIFVMPETHKNSIWEEGRSRRRRHVSARFV